MRRREKRREKVLVICHERKTIQRFVVSQVKSIYSHQAELVTIQLKRGVRGDKRSCCIS
jgi:hypothetical protein